MADSVYKVTEIVGTSPESWDKAAAVAIERASGRCAICASPRSPNRIW